MKRFALNLFFRLMHRLNKMDGKLRSRSLWNRYYGTCKSWGAALAVLDRHGLMTEYDVERMKPEWRPEP